MTPEQLRILKTLPKVIKAVRAFQAEANELMGLLGQGTPPPDAANGPSCDAPGPDGRTCILELGHVFDHGDRTTGWDRAWKPSVGVAPPVLTTLRTVPNPRQAQEEAEARATAQAELQRRLAARTPEQVEADEYLASQEGTRKSLLAAILPGGTP